MSERSETNVEVDRVVMADSCIGCKHNQAGRWVGWPCKKGVPGDDDEDYSCFEEDADKSFWFDGEFSMNYCPSCGAQTLINRAGDEWCSFVNCDWQRGKAE